MFREGLLPSSTAKSVSFAIKVERHCFRMSVSTILQFKHEYSLRGVITSQSCYNDYLILHSELNQMRESLFLSGPMNI